MTSEQQEQLRAKFKPAQIGKLPKAGRQLDYVGHAVVTERLLEVDPNYEFGPVLDVNRRPITHQAGKDLSVLYYLTVGGSTKYEWGDGPNMKEISSDAIRRCAMRFGVALDLWAKEPLVEQDAEAQAPKRAARAKRSEMPPSRSPAAAPNPPSQRAIMAFASQNSIDDETRHRITRRIAGVTSSKDVPTEMIEKVVAALKWYVDHPESLRKIEEWEREQGIVAA